MPRPPARDTADASWVRAIHPIGACTIGYRAPAWARTRFMTVHCCEGKAGGGIPEQGMPTLPLPGPCLSGGFQRLAFVAPPRRLSADLPRTPPDRSKELR